MTDGPAQTIKEKLDIVEFLRGYLPMIPAGKNLKARCPFHNEKTPSFMISPERQTWHCFGCGLGGDIFAFLMKYENMEFGEALKVLAEKAGVELKRADPREYKVFGLLYELQDAAKDFWKEQLKTAKIAKDYLNERGLTPETIEEFEIGFAPNDQDSLAMYLINKGYDPADITRAGLIGRTERGLQYDRFRGRIMFPIHNHLGKVVGFTGRILPQLDTGELGKYVNSPETPIFNKSKLLYGFWKSKSAVRESGKAYLVEGQMDFLMSYQAGVKNAVATSGTALTPDHILALRKIAEELLVSFDNDDAGFAAGERAIDLAEAGGMQVRIVSLEGVKDPAEAAQKDPKILGEAIAKAEPAFKVFFRRYLPWGKVDPLNHAELKNLRILLNKIKSISSPVERDYWLKDLATYAKMSESTLKEEMEKVQVVQAPERFREEEKIIPERKYSRGERISKDLLGAAYSRGDYSILNDVEDLLDPSSKKLLKTLKSGAKKAADPEEDAFLNLVILEAADVSDGEIADMKSALKDGSSKTKRLELTERVKEAEAKGDEEALKKAIEELRSLPPG
ncbi:MAG: DNA primase [Parcubacteria group bacterium LiPW_15]|nr:MAG: DNA primase [Parcubacteria group bacterium LiPW_15]